VDDDIFIKRAFAPIGLLEIHAAFRSSDAVEN
jgi:hypothetical protein